MYIFWTVRAAVVSSGVVTPQTTNFLKLVERLGNRSLGDGKALEDEDLSDGESAENEDVFEDEAVEDTDDLGDDDAEDVTEDDDNRRC